MLRALEFPITYPAWGDGNVTMTFETMAVPPLHERVTAVCGWVYNNGELLIARSTERGWELPGGVRWAGETFAQTLSRATWEDTGVLLGPTRLIGAFRTTNLAEDGKPTYVVCLLAEAREVVPFGDAFEAEERALVEPQMLAEMVTDWSPLMEEVLAYAEAVHQPTPVDDYMFAEAAVA